MSFKSATQSLLKSFFSWVKTQFNYTIKALRADNEAEFTSMRSFLNDYGTVFQHSCPHTPQQNVVVERKPRHLLNVGNKFSFKIMGRKSSNSLLPYKSSSYPLVVAHLTL